MTPFLAVFRWEVAQMWRGVGLRLLLPLLFLAGVAASALGQTRTYFDIALPANSIPVLWGTYITATLVLGLLVFVVATEFLLRDARDRVDEVLATVALSDGALAAANYLVVACSAVALAIVLLLGLLAGEWAMHGTGSPHYPTVWVSRYVVLWCLLPLPATVFASALSFLGTILLGNRRPVLYLAYLLFWLAPILTSVALPTYQDAIGIAFNRDTVQPYYTGVEQEFLHRVFSPADFTADGAMPRVISLVPVEAEFVRAMDAYPPFDDLVSSRVAYVAFAGLLMVLATWRFRRFQVEGRKA